jgi:hypothetical protein
MMNTTNMTTHNEKATEGISEHSSTEMANGVEPIRTISRVPGNPHYYEKDGLRTYGDDEDHDHEPPMTVNRALSLVAMAFLFTGSQIPVYLFGKPAQLPPRGAAMLMTSQAVSHHTSTPT